MKSEILYEDTFGEIIDRPDSGFIEIRWYDSTEKITDDEFNRWLSEFAGYVEQKNRISVLIDAVQFRMPPEQMNIEWRNENIIPRYNTAAVQKFAFIMPSGMPLIGNDPAPEGPAQFPTCYFSNRYDAVEWLLKEA